MCGIKKHWVMTENQIIIFAFDGSITQVNCLQNKVNLIFNDWI